MTTLSTRSSGENRLDRLCYEGYTRVNVKTPNNPTEVRPLKFEGDALDDLKAIPDELRHAFGHALWEIQNGVTPENASPFEGFTANEVMKVSERHDGDTSRCVYAAKFERRVYILHVFQKKSKSGIATPKAAIERVRRRFLAAKAEYEAEFGMRKEKRQ